MTKFITTLALLAGSVWASTAYSAEITLKMAHFLPTANGMHKDFLEPWARDLEACSGGKVEVQIFPAGTQLGNPAKLYDEVRSGVVDIAHGLSGVPSGRFERLRIAELPFIFSSAGQASQILWSMHEAYFDAEFDGVKLLALHGHNPGEINTVSTSVKVPDDMIGLRIRFPTDATREMIAALGGTPVGLPPGAVYENAEKSVIDGAVFSWDAMDSFKLAEVMKHHLDVKAYITTFWFAMNERTYAGLPDDVRACVDKLSGDALAPKFGDWWNAWEAAGYESVKGPDHEIVTLTDAERQVWIDKLTPTIDTQLDALVANGVENAHEIYDAMKTATQK